MESGYLLGLRVCGSSGSQDEVYMVLGFRLTKVFGCLGLHKLSPEIRLHASCGSVQPTWILTAEGSKSAKD